MWAAFVLLFSPVLAGESSPYSKAAQAAPEPPAAGRAEDGVIVRIELPAFRGRSELIELRNEVPILPEVWRTLDALVGVAGTMPGPERGRLCILQKPDDDAGQVVGLLSDEAFDPDATRTAATLAGWGPAGSPQEGMLAGPARSAGVTSAGESSPGPVLRFPGSGRLLFGSRRLVRAGNSTLSPLEAACEQQGGRYGETGSVTPGDAALALLHGRETIRLAIGELLPAEAFDALSGYLDIDELRLSVAVRQPVEVEAVALSPDEGRAAAFADATRAVLGLSKLAAMQGDDAEGLEALRSIRIEQDGGRVVIRATLTAAFLESRRPAPPAASAHEATASSSRR